MKGTENITPASSRPARTGGRRSGFSRRISVPERGARGEDAIPVDDSFHRFGRLWDKEGFTFYVDGVQSGRKLTAGVSHTEEFIF